MTRVKVRELHRDPLRHDPFLGAGRNEEEVLLAVVVEAEAAVADLLAGRWQLARHGPFEHEGASVVAVRGAMRRDVAPDAF